MASNGSGGLGGGLSVRSGSHVPRLQGREQPKEVTLEGVCAAYIVQTAAQGRAHFQRAPFAPTEACSNSANRGSIVWRHGAQDATRVDLDRYRTVAGTE
jgi:hypothetical protein